MEWLAAIRDIAIILLAVETIVVGIALLVLLWQSWKLVGVVRGHLDTVIGHVDTLTGSANEILGIVKETAHSAAQTAQSAAETAREAQATASFVTDRTAAPVIELYSAVAGAAKFAEAVFRGRRNGHAGGRS